MKCREVEQLLSPYLDSRLGRQEGEAVVRHLASCRDCHAAYQTLRTTVEALGSLPRVEAPPILATRIRVAASKIAAERRAAQNLAAWAGAWIDRLKLTFDNLMRPLALPAVCGLASAVVLFSVLVPAVAFQQVDLSSDVPLMLRQEPTLKRMFPPALTEDDIAVELWLDQQGRPVLYAMDPSYRNNQDLRRQIENTLLFTQFEPATSFGQPKPSRLILYFNRRHIDVRG